MFERIVSLEPSVTAMLVALGQRRRLVAVTHYCQRLVDVGDLPQLEPTWSVEAGEVAALAPDLVIAGVPYRAGQVDELLKARLNVLCLYPNSLADVYAHITWLGRLCGVPERADAVVRHMQSELAALQAPHLRAGQGRPASLRRRVAQAPDERGALDRRNRGDAGRDLRAAAARTPGEPGGGTRRRPTGHHPQLGWRGSDRPGECGRSPQLGGRQCSPGRPGGSRGRDPAERTGAESGGGRATGVAHPGRGKPCI
jgi:hypothetical protein